MIKPTFAIVGGAVILSLAHSAAAWATSPAMDVRMQVSDTSGHPISTIAVGAEYEIQAFVQDQRFQPSNPGVFSAYVDVSYGAALSTVAGPVSHGSDFDFAVTGDLSNPGLMQNVGGFSGSIVPTGLNEQLLWTVDMTATASGIETFTPSASSTPGAEFDLYGDNDAVPPSLVEFFPASVTIVPEPASLVLAGVGSIALLVVFRARRAA